jgi:hypothetical protein
MANFATLQEGRFRFFPLKHLKHEFSNRVKYEKKNVFSKHI